MDSSNTITSRPESVVDTTQTLVDEYIKTPSKSVSKSISKSISKTPSKTSRSTFSMPTLSIPKSLKDVGSTKSVTKTKRIWTILKIIVIVAVFGYIFYKVKPIISILMGIASIFKSMGSSQNKQFQQLTKGLDKQKEKPKKPKMKGMPSGTPNLHKQKQTIIPKKSSGVKYKKPPSIPVPDDSMSEIQNKKPQSGHCYIGKWKGYRSCISVNNANDCYSGEIYPTNELCINPKMRE